MIVVDTNIIAYLFLPSEHSSQAELLLRRDPQWVAPVLWRSEFHNVLALYIRKSILSLEEALDLMDDATDLMQDQEFAVSSPRVLSLVAASTCSAYGCEFVALAQMLGVPLVTADRRILNQFPLWAVSLNASVG